MTTDYAVSRDSLLLRTPLESLHQAHPGLWRVDACGVTRAGRQIAVLVHADAYSRDANRSRVLILGGLYGLAEDMELTFRAVEKYAAAGAALSDKIALSAIPCANPDGLALGIGPDNGANGNPSAGYPPDGAYFDSRTDPEVRYLWQWICYQAPDLIVELRTGDSPYWEANYAAGPIARALDAAILVPAGSLLYEIGEGTPSGLEPIPGIRLTAAAHLADPEIERLWRAVLDRPDLRPSPASKLLDRRGSRSPLEVARPLADAYGHRLDQMIYTQGVSLSGRMRYQEIDKEYRDPTSEIRSLVEPYVSSARKAFGDRPEPPNYCGAAWADELHARTGDGRYRDFLLQAAKGAAEYVRARSADAASFRVEDVFFISAILGRAYRIAAENEFLNVMTGYLDLMCAQQQANGLFWHAREAPFFWGRGNGFVALGLAEALAYLPPDHAVRERVLETHWRHVDAMADTQCPSGMLRQVLDFSGSYEEHSATCMFGYALASGMRNGWLERAKYESVLAMTWRAVAERIDAKGGVVSVCAGTGFQPDLRSYLDRPAISGHDDRGGALALWFATEMGRLSAIFSAG
ncbi:MAG: glycoside hydrolase family 88 protein [Chloroflexi bacterium]|nr:glycoside hydrolase family 88 protein [Chloroflexota bacterium]